MNAHAVRRRYPALAVFTEFTEYEAMIAAYRYRPRGAGLLQLIESLRCLPYQCLEDDVGRCPSFGDVFELIRPAPPPWTYCAHRLGVLVDP